MNPGVPVYALPAERPLRLSRHRVTDDGVE
jgi:hypothetical protein